MTWWLISTKNLKIYSAGAAIRILKQYRCDDADFVAICLGSLSYHLRDVVDILREEGIPVGVMGLRLYRPFPDQAVRDALSGRKGVIVFEKALSYGNQGALYADIKSALYTIDNRPTIHNYILGLGGREIKTHHLEIALRDILYKTGHHWRYAGVDRTENVDV